MVFSFVGHDEGLKIGLGRDLVFLFFRTVSVSVLLDICEKSFVALSWV